MRKINAEVMEKAERILAIRGELGGMLAVHEIADVDSEALGALVQHHIKGTLVQSVPDLDPRIEAPLNTIAAHFFMVGAVSERLINGNERVPE
jgi:hypothetical protein